MLHLSISTLTAVVDKAMTDAAAHPRWLNAIDRGLAELVSNPFISRQSDGSLLIASSTSTNIYTASASRCECEAFSRGIPCWHRGAARLVRLHDEAIERERSDTDRRARWAAAQAALDECFA